ncbi:MAG: class I SAM-dependent DNA methyltransferase [Bosea sp.]|nr:class I SAM-dependent DNA methyltransferase [Bosea sp. (in: a-proteobacteria)]
MTPDQFVEKWRASTLKERSASQSHFNDLCKLLGVDNPTDADPKGERYCFERGASKTAGGEGWADVWMRNHFGWEYKGKRKDLTAAYAQLQQYAVALENPPLLVVSDMERIVIHTNWTNTVSEVHSITLDDLRDANKRDLLRSVFTDPERLKPKKTIDALTRDVADTFAGLAISLREAGNDPQAVAHFVNRLVFCMFAEDINLLPRRLFSQILDKARLKPAMATAMLSQLFEAMRAGGLFGVDEIEWFNGGLFDDATALPLTVTDIKTIARASEMDWSDIDPSIFGTLFERGLDPAKRSQLGAHYTDPEKIMMIVRPVIIEPLWREWEGVKAQIEKPKTPEKKKRALLGGFLERLRGFRVLDPACGSGNFLYLALLALKDIEHRVNLEAEAMGLGRQFPTVGPEVVQGIELNPYAAELARVTIWIGEIQWMRKNGFDISKKPILKPLKNIENRDALLNSDGSRTVWPEVDVVIGNPPFLGQKFHRKGRPANKRSAALEGLGDDYVNKLYATYRDAVPASADLVSYWFAQVHNRFNAGRLKGFGLIATKSIGKRLFGKSAIGVSVGWRM